MTFDDLRERRGKFTISHRLIETAPSVVIELMRNVLVTRAESNWCRKVIEYEALSPAFDVIPDGYDTQAYVVHVGGDQPPEFRKP